jgi:SAM-dependent methyltransferase
MVGSGVSAHYASFDSTAVIAAALRELGADQGRVTPESLAPLDQFHLGGMQATLDLAHLAGARTGMRVLDAGGGLGGPARILASRFGCAVSVVDLTQRYCEIGELLTRFTHLEDRVDFRQGDMLALPFESETFDLVWTQHASMNIADKPRLYAELRRVLRPGGRLAVHEVVAGRVQPLHFPVPWARDASLSFLLAGEAQRRVIADAGFAERAWHDVTEAAVDATRSRVASPPEASASMPSLGLQLVMGPDFRSMAQNFIRNATEQRVSVVQAVFDRA